MYLDWLKYKNQAAEMWAEEYVPIEDQSLSLKEDEAFIANIALRSHNLVYKDFLLGYSAKQYIITIHQKFKSPFVVFNVDGSTIKEDKKNKICSCGDLYEAFDAAEKDNRNTFLKWQEIRTKKDERKNTLGNIINSVATTSDLIAGMTDGELCLVKENSQLHIWEDANDRWIQIPTADPSVLPI